MTEGFLPVRKEQGFTSMDVVAKLRGILHMRKIGHAGTLDPMAEGVLLIALGSATRAISLLPDREKEYAARITLGKATDTEDIWGNVTEISDNIVSSEELRQTILSFAGGYDQVPPMVSAKKVGGKKLYQLARAGQVVERQPVPVKFPEIEVLSVGCNQAEFRVRCSEGTYSRSLCRDIGAKLSMPACMSALTRTEACGIRIDQALTLDEIQRKADAGTIAENIVSIEQMLRAYPAVTVTEAWDLRVRNGSAFDETAVAAVPGEMYASEEDLPDADIPGADIRKDSISGDGTPQTPYRRVYLPDGTFQAVYRIGEADGIYRPVKILGGRN